ESWEVYWKNRVANGEFKGKTLGELIELYPEEMVGRKDASPEFPLLIKFIDAQDWLSVQVHPADKLAAELKGEPRGKTECWYIVDAKPGAQIVYGFSKPIDANEFRKRLESGRAEDVKDVLQFVDVASGDFIYVPAGTLHAIGPGILLYELQQTSDTTYRVYDWDRPGLDGKPRELHIEKSLKSIHFDVMPEAIKPLNPSFHGPYFGLTKISSQKSNSGSDIHVHGSGAYILTVAAGGAKLNAGPDIEPVRVLVGQSVFLPSQIGGVALEHDKGKTDILCAM